MGSFHSLQKKVLNTAKEWWESKRPADYDQERHIAMPTAGIQSPAEHRLARAVAQMVHEGWRTDESYALVNDLFELSRELEKGKGSLNIQVFQKKHDVYRRAEAFLGKRIVNDDTTPQTRPRRLVRMHRDGDEF